MIRERGPLKPHSACQSATFVRLLQPTPSLVAGTTITNTATASSAAIDPDTSDNSGSATTIESVVNVSDVTKNEGNSRVTAFTFLVTLTGTRRGRSRFKSRARSLRQAYSLP